MDYTTLQTENKESELCSQEQGQSLYHLCQLVTDGRKRRGRRYELAGILLVIVLAKLAGMSSLLAVCEWAKDQERMPCANTYSNVLAGLNSQQVNAQVAAWFVRQHAQQRCGEAPGRLCADSGEQHVHLAIDGKALKGTGTKAYGGEHPQQHLLHVYEVETGIVLQQIPVETKTNEVGALKPLLTEVLCKGRVLTADAAQSYHAFPRLVKRAGGDTILIVKNNTPVTRADLVLFFEDKDAEKDTWQAFEQVEKGHGRLERRHITVSPDLNGLFFKEWGEIGQVFRLLRERTIKGTSTCEITYGLTTLTVQQCSPERLLQYIRDHWKVENQLHWCRDAILGEDRCRVRYIPVMEMLAVLNTTVLSLMHLHHISTITRQIRRFASHPEEALAWLL